MPWALKPKSSLIDKVRQDSALAYIQRKGKMVLLPLDAPGHVEDLFLRPMTTNPQSEIRLMRRPASPTMPPAGRSQGTAMPDLSGSRTSLQTPGRSASMHSTAGMWRSLPFQAGFAPCTTTGRINPVDPTGR